MVEQFIDKLGNGTVDQSGKVAAFVEFLKAVTSGFGSRFSSVLHREIACPSRSPRGQIPPMMATMASQISEDEGHVGYCEAAATLRELIISKQAPFNEIRLDYPRELNDFIQLQEFDDPKVGLAEIIHRRSRVHPSPPSKCLSTIHKCKGLEADTVILFAGDKTSFPDNLAKRNLLYVALSRATKEIYLVVSKNDPTPIFQT
ncbi:ATP-binding domain-containing protein [Pararhizobium sp. A13]|uniref:ATP-binding domain-containing protein n=1 Tax=Pararhizobium sp. A13 TaxID=3133975 RepID=UPI0032461C85